MTEADKAMVGVYNKMIEDLENEYFTAKQNQEQITGSQNEVYQKVGQNILAENKFYEKKRELERLRDEAIGVSSGVEAFLNNKPETSKFDVDAGKVKIDDSLNRLGGKAL